MKKIYWRPGKVPRVILIIIAILAVVVMASVESFKVDKKQSFYAEKIDAAHTMKNAMAVLREHRMKLADSIDFDVDPTGSGLIGLPASLITSNTGYLRSKQTSINPNWAAVIVHMLAEAGVGQGDTVAMGFSGSFPALNIAALAAAKTLGLKVISISSVSASTWGANIPEFTWLDMERVLRENGILPYRSAAASLGGEADRALGMSKKSVKLLEDAIVRNQVKPIEVNKVVDSIDRRMEIYTELAEGNRIAAYVNIGGSKVSVGSKKIKREYTPGLNLDPPPVVQKVDSVMSRFARQEVPIIHMIFLDTIADHYGLEKSPVVMPKIGIGQIYIKTGYSLYLAAAGLALLVAMLYIFLKMDIGYRIFGSGRILETPKHPELMV